MFSADDHTHSWWHQRLAPIPHDLLSELLAESLLCDRGLGALQELYSVVPRVISWGFGRPLLLGGLAV